MESKVIKIGGHPYDESLLSSNPYLIDAGAFRGQFCLPFLKRHGGKALCLEPNIAQFPVTWRDLNIVVKQAALTAMDHKDDIEFNVYTDRLDCSSIFPRSDRGNIKKLKIPSVTLREICNIPVDLVKLNIEGEEWELLCQAKHEDLANVSQIAAEFHYGNLTPENMKIEDVIANLKSLGFEVDVKTTGPDHAELQAWRVK